MTFAGILDLHMLACGTCLQGFSVTQPRCLTKQPGSQPVLHCPQRCWMGWRSGVCAVQLSYFTATHLLELALCLGALSRNKKETKRKRWHKVIDLTTQWIRNKSNSTKYLQKSNYFVVWIELWCCQSNKAAKVHSFLCFGAIPIKTQSTQEQTTWVSK